MAIQLVDETHALTAAQATSLLERYMPVGAELTNLSARERGVISKLQILAQGRTYIDIERTIEAGGFDEMGRPKLAACHPLCESRLHTYTRRRQQRQVMELSCCRTTWRKERVLPRLTFRERLAGNWPDEMASCYAKTPMIPAIHRPADLKQKNLREYFLIFEAIWGKTSSVPVDLDPILLRFDGHGWVVHAVWDLTEVEAQALAQGVLDR